MGIILAGSALTLVCSFVASTWSAARLRAASEGLFPASLAGQEAAADFASETKGFEDAVVLGEADLLAAADEAGRRSLASLQKIASLDGVDAERRSDARGLAADMEGFAAAARPVYAKLAAGATDDGAAELRARAADLAARSAALTARLDKLVRALQGDMRTELRGIEEADRGRQLAGAAALAVVLAIAAGMAALVTGSITKVLGKATSDLASDADRLSALASQVASSSQSLADGTNEQAASLEETSASLEEMASMTRRNSEHAKRASELSVEAREAAGKGAAAMSEVQGAVAEIAAGSRDISKIIDAIEEIAFQTNLLALNAAVEAARAGEHGRGFAVVADEVRNLAQRAASAARETTELIEKSVALSGRGKETTDAAAKTLVTVVDGIRKASDLVDEIAAACREQSQGIEQVNGAVGQMDRVTQRNAAGAEEGAAAADELARHAERMRGSVGDVRKLLDGGAAEAQAGTAASRASAVHKDKADHERRRTTLGGHGVHDADRVPGIFAGSEA